MTQRDRTILVVVGVLALFGGFWFLVLGPKRDRLHKLDQQVSKSEQDLAATRGEAQQYAQDRLQFPRTYAAVVRLGKAAPADPDVPSLLVQLENAASRAGVDFRKIALETSGSAAAPAPAPPAPTPPATGTSGPTGPQGAGGSPSGGKTGQAGAQGGNSGPSQPGASASTAGGGSGATGPSAAGASPVPADAVTAATTPIGTQVGPAQLPTLKFTLIFQGNFFKMAGFIHNVRSLVKRNRRGLVVSGRLLTIDAITFKEGDFGFPQVKASIAATAYVLPATQGLLGGATPQGPGGATAATPAPVSTPSASTPPSAVVTAR